MITLALDLGSTTGWAVGDRHGRFASGSVTHLNAKQLREQKKTSMERRCDGRVVALADWVGKTLVEWKIERVVFEDVLFIQSLAQGQLWSSFRAAVWVQCMVDRGTPIEMHCLPVATIKKFFTGHGGAEKVHMAQALLDGRRGYRDEFHVGTNKKGDTDLLERKSGRSVDDNEVDALAILAFAAAVDAGTAVWPYDA